MQRVAKNQIVSCFYRKINRLLTRLTLKLLIYLQTKTIKMTMKIRLIDNKASFVEIKDLTSIQKCCINKEGKENT